MVERRELNIGRLLVKAIRNSNLSAIQQRTALLALIAGGLLNIITAGDAAYDSIVRALKDTDCSKFYVKYGAVEKNLIENNCGIKRISYILRALGHVAIATQLSSEVFDLIVNEL
jgi:hypothetical protein